MVAGLCVITSCQAGETPLPDQEPTAQIRALPRDVRAGKGVFAKSVGAFVPKVTATVFQKFGFHSAEIMSSWATIVGAEVARLTRPESIKWPRGGKNPADDADDSNRSAGATLIIATDPAFALEVSYRHKEIIDRINRYFGYRAIAQIKVHQVPRLDEPAAAPNATLRAVPREPVPAASGDLDAALEALGRSVAAASRR
jgi:hypothetical protein